MPIYEYRCKNCGTKFDKFVRSLSDQGVVQCPECGSQEVEKAISMFGVGVSSRASGSRATSCSTGPV